MSSADPAAAYARALLDRLAVEVPLADRDRPTGAAADWAASGAMALTGAASGPPQLVRGAPATATRGALMALHAVASAVDAPAALPDLRLLGERAALGGLRRQGPVSAGGATRLLPSADGHLALTLSRAADIELVPALLEVASITDDVWPAVADWCRSTPTAAVVERATLLGLAAAALPTAPTAPTASADGAPLGRKALPATRLRRPGRWLVVDLSALWAGPLCSHLLMRLGATVVVVESPRRPDPTRTAMPEFHQLLRTGARHVSVDLATRGGRQQLRRLLASAAVVIEGSRPRALRQLGIDADAAADGGAVWISITGHGRDGPGANRIGYGDDVAAGAGLVGDGPVFAGDALADPMAGVHAALAAYAAVVTGRRGVVDIAMHDVAGRAAGTPPDAQVVRRGERWWVDTGGDLLPVREPVVSPRQGSPVSGGGQPTRRRPAGSVLLQRVEVRGRLADVRLARGRIVAVSPEPLRAEPGEEVVAGDRGALLPGLHDHHLHLLAMAAGADSVDVSGGLGALATAAGRGWVRGVGLTGDDVDAATLDRYVADRPARVQHRSGAMWVLNTAGLAAVLGGTAPPAGMECDRTGRPTGRLWRIDGWLGERVRELDRPPDLAAVGRRLRALGVTGVTDATPDLDAAAQRLLAAAGARLRVQSLAATPPHGVAAGPRKIVIADHDLPSYDELRSAVVGTRRVGRAVAVHCVTRAALALLIAVLDEIGSRRGDRVEHAAVADPSAAAALARLGVAVVTQPGFIAARGDDYLRDVDPADVVDLYPFASLLRAGVTVVASSDAPYGPADPWQVMRAASERCAPSGRPVTTGEAVSVATVLDGYLRPLDALDAPPRQVVPGAPADLVLLAAPLQELLAAPHADLVRMTWVSGQASGPGHRYTAPAPPPCSSPGSPTKVTAPRPIT